MKWYNFQVKAKNVMLKGRDEFMYTMVVILVKSEHHKFVFAGYEMKNK